MSPSNLWKFFSSVEERRGGKVHHHSESIFDAEIVNAEAEGYFTRAMVPKTVDVRNWMVPVVGEIENQVVISEDFRLLQTMHTFLDLDEKFKNV